jgi:putative toxin-antitoxin system antitoxin component (TIGR02293 family)
MYGSDKIERGLASAIHVYESRERAIEWLSRPNSRLDGIAPLELLQTEDGARRVEELLGQIDEGYFV